MGTIWRAKVFGTVGQKLGNCDVIASNGLDVFLTPMFSFCSAVTLSYSCTLKRFAFIAVLMTCLTDEHMWHPFILCFHDSGDDLCLLDGLSGTHPCICLGRQTRGTCGLITLDTLA